MDYQTSPDYLKAADLHNIGSGGESFFDAPIENTVDFVSKIPSFAISSVASGINSIYNSGVVAGNYLGLTDAKENDLQSTLGSFDSDLGKYYSEHKAAADLTGFIATSLIPGTLGIKAVNAGQRMLLGAKTTGLIGSTLADSTGLVRSVSASGKSLTQLAGESLATSGQQFTFANAAVLKAVAGGVGQATLDSLGFEMMVQATMFKSPILDGQDFKDMAKNVVTGTILGGAIGGAFNTASVYGGVTKEINKKAAELFPFKKLESTHFLPLESDKIVMRAGDIEVMPAGLTAEQVKAAEKTIASARQDIRISLHEIGDDQLLVNTLADSLEKESGDVIANALSGAKIIQRAMFDLTPKEGEAVGHLNLRSGDVTFDPLVRHQVNLADRFPPNGGMSQETRINNLVAAQKFSEKKLWNPTQIGNLDEVEARYIWADKFAKYENGMTIHAGDIPLQEGALKAGLTNVVIDDGVHAYRVTNLDDLANEVLQNKKALVNGFGSAKNAAWTLDGESIVSGDIARIVNADVKAIEGDMNASWYARQDAQTLSNQTRESKGLKPVDLDYIPSVSSITYDSRRLENVNPDLISALINTRTIQKINSDKASVAFASISEELADRFPQSFRNLIPKANPSGAGSGLLTSSNSGPGSLGSVVEYIGKGTADLTSKLKKVTEDTLGSVALRLRTNQAAAIEFSALNDLRNSTTERYVLNSNANGLILKSVDDYNKSIASGKTNVSYPKTQEGAPVEVLFKNKDAGDAIIADIQRNGQRVQHEISLRQAEGSTNEKDGSIFYGWKPDEKSMKYFAFVKDTTVTGEAAGHTSMIHANSPEQLNAMIKLAEERPGFKVYTKVDGEKFYKAQGDYKFDRTLHENYMDSQLKSAGVNNQFNPKTDPNSIVDEWLQHHSMRDTILARDAVATKYGNEFDMLHSLGAEYTNVAASQKGVTVRAIESTIKNPYNDYAKTALNISRMSEYPIWNSVNRFLEDGTNKVIQNIVDAYKNVTTVSQLEGINSLLESAGINHAYKSAAEVVLANHSMPKPYLSNFIRGANSILASTFLKLDFLNPIVNAVSAQVLLGHETSGQYKNLLRDVEVAGVTVPGTTATILSPSKMIARANADFLNGSPQLDELFKHQGLTTTYKDILKSMLDDLSLSGSETVAISQNKLHAALQKSKQLVEDVGEFGAKWTGNNLAEEYNRFVAAHVAKQMHDVRVANGMATSDDLGAFMNTFVNRTQTNTLSSQRPLLFQGPVGQAIGLFQSFQFNTMQQLFRGVAEGGPKDAAMLLGLQGTIFGLNGLPGFQYINQHIVGTASGNPNHTDAYSSVYGAMGKTTGDWLMYGIPSNLLQTNLYSRGDINPRQLSVVPVNPLDVVAVSAFSKFAGNLYDTLGKIAGGGAVWESVLQGLEHNGLSRPLAGLAQTLQATDGGKVYSTTGKGDISFVNDLFSLATLSRLAGGKPLDEALANDEISRALVYKATDRARMADATETFKASVIGDTRGVATPKATENYMKAFVHNGGRVEDFNKSMIHAMTQVNTPRANQIIQTLKGPYGEHMKSLMGGKLVEDLQEM